TLRDATEEEPTDPAAFPWLGGNALGEVVEHCLAIHYRWAWTSSSARRSGDREAPVSASLARIVGLDVARAIALLGMFASHVGNEHPPDGWPWLEVFHGRSAAIF